MRMSSLFLLASAGALFLCACSFTSVSKSGNFYYKVKKPHVYKCDKKDSDIKGDECSKLTD